MRSLQPLYAAIHFGPLCVKIRHGGLVRNKAVYLAIGVDCHGNKDIFGLWIGQTEGAGFWLRVLSEVKACGTQDVLIAVVDGLKGSTGAITTAVPECLVQTCIVSAPLQLPAVGLWKEPEALARALQTIYGVASAEAAAAVDRFEADTWGQECPPVVRIGRQRWAEVIHFFVFFRELRKLIYTTNAI